MKLKPSARKWLVIPLLFVMFALLGSLSSGINLLDRAIVVGVALDGAPGDLTLTAQIVVPQNGGTASGGDKFAIFHSKGETVAEAVENLSLGSGLRASFAHTDVILFGTDLLKAGPQEPLEYIFKSDLVRDTALLVAVPGEAGELLKTKLTVGESVSYHLLEMLQSNRDEAGQNPMTLQRYYFDWFTLGGACYMPLVTAVEEKDGSIAPDATDDAYRLELTDTVVMTREGYALRLDGEESKGLSYGTKRINSGTIPYEDGDGRRQDAVILDSHPDFRAVGEREVKLDLTVMCRPAEKPHSEGGRQVGVLDGRAVEQIAADIEEKVRDCFEACREKDCDVFGIREVLYRRYGARIRKEGDGLLRKIELTVDVHVFTK